MIYRTNSGDGSFTCSHLKNRYYKFKQKNRVVLQFRILPSSSSRRVFFKSLRRNNDFLPKTKKMYYKDTEKCDTSRVSIKYCQSGFINFAAYCSENTP